MSRALHTRLTPTGIRLPALLLTLALALLGAFLLPPSSAAGESAASATDATIVFGQPDTALDGLEVRFLDIGAGDSIYLRCEDESMLVDGGVSGDGDRIKEYFDEQGVTGVTYMLNTHCHNDHIGGLNRLLRLGFTAGKGLSPYKPDRKTDSFRQFVDGLGKCGAPYRMAVEGDVIPLGDATVTVYRQTDAAALRLGNDNALVLLVRYGERTLLLTADLGGATQRRLAVRVGDALRADIVKSAHHGMAVFVDELLQAVQPLFAVCTGRKSNVPNFAKQMERLGLNALYAAEGVVHLRTDGETWYVWQTGHMAKPGQDTVIFPATEE